jgi:hypothetical protein
VYDGVASYHCEMEKNVVIYDEIHEIIKKEFLSMNLLLLSNAPRLNELNFA